MNEPIPGLACPLPRQASEEVVTLAHGEGGRLMRKLIRERILPVLGEGDGQNLPDAVCLPSCAGSLALTTDSFVVSPLFFPGGDIGSLAVYGTVNDLFVSGAHPRWLSLALIIEEGLPLAVLDKVLASAARAAQHAGVTIVAGDTKVVPRGTADSLFINTTGVGEFIDARPPGPASLEAGDALLISGSIGRHGMAVMTSREGFQFDPSPISDSAPLGAAVAALRGAGVPVRAMRDATRGGLAAVLYEWAEASNLTMVLDEPSIPVTPEVRGACEVLGLDPVHVACEGTMVIAVPAAAAAAALDALRRVDVARQTAAVGRVQPRDLAPVVVHRAFGQKLPLDQPLGAPLPRIC